MHLISSFHQNNKVKRIKLHGWGDSITDDVGTSGRNASFADPITRGVMGYLTQCFNRLNTTGRFSLYRSGWPGRTAEWFKNNQLTNALAQIDKSYDLNIVVIFFGANDLTQFSSSKTYTDIVYLHNAARAAGARTIAVPVLNRKDIHATSGFNGDRLAVNANFIANWQTFANEIAQLWEFDDIYLEDAPLNEFYFAKNDVDGLTGVHPTDNGAKLIAEGVAKAIARYQAIGLSVFVPPVDNIAPIFLSATVTASDSSRIDLLYNETMQLGVLAASDFTVSGRTVSSVSVSGRTVRVFVSVPFTTGESISISGGNNKIIDKAGNATANLSSQTVTNMLVTNDEAVVWTSLSNVTNNSGELVKSGSSEVVWNASAIGTKSVQNSAGAGTKGTLTFVANKNTPDAICGLTVSIPDSSYETMDFGWYWSGSEIRVIEKGVFKFDFSWNSATLANLSIQVTDTQVKYYIDSVLKYTSTKPSVFPLIPKAVLYNNGSSKVSGATIGGNLISTDTTVTALQTISFATINNIQNNSGVWSPITPNGTGWGNTGLSVTKLQAGSTGWVELQTSTDSANKFGMIGVKTSNALGGFATFKYSTWGFVTGSSFEVSRIIDGSPNSVNGPLIPAGSRLRLLSKGGAFSLEYSLAGGWKPLMDLGTYAGDVWVVTDIRGDGKLTTPKGFGLV